MRVENQYLEHLKRDLQKIEGFSYDELPYLHQYPDHIARKVLKLLLESACCPTNIRPITLGREGILKIDPKWL